jgi:4-amino-4-deoxy-L-arabinose transferase-like glycosyltransferase
LAITKSTPPQPAATRGFLPAWAATFGGLFLIVATYRLIYSLALAWAPPAIGMDNVADNVWAQQLLLVYQLRQPPLFEWLLWPIQQVLGPTRESFLVVKGLLMTGTALCLFGAARNAIADRHMASLAVLSYALFYNVSWTMLDRLTQSSLLLCCCAAVVWIFIRSVRTGHLIAYAALGLALGAGFLAKFNFALFAASLLTASLLERHFRQRLRPVGLAVAAAVAGLVVSPYVFGLVAAEAPMLDNAAAIMLEGARTPYLARIGTGLSLFLVSIAAFSLPFVPLFLAFFWRPFLDGALPMENERAAHARLFGLTSGIAACLALLGIIASGTVYVRDWHTLPIFVTLPLWMFARIEAGGVLSDRLRPWIRIILVVVVATATVRIGAALAPDAAYCGRCDALKPYGVLAEELEKLGASDATLVVLDVYTAGNLRMHAPRARIVTPGFDKAAPAKHTPLCFAIWDARDGAAPTGIDSALQAAGLPASNLVGSGEDRFVTRPWPEQWYSARIGSTTWGIRQLDQSVAMCAGASGR